MHLILHMLHSETYLVNSWIKAPIQRTALHYHLQVQHVPYIAMSSG